MPAPDFTIDHAFFMQGRGLILVSSAFDRKATAPVQVCVGDELEITTKIGASIRTTVTGVEMMHGTPLSRYRVGIRVALPDDHGSTLEGAIAQVTKAPQ